MKNEKTKITEEGQMASSTQIIKKGNSQKIIEMYLPDELMHLEETYEFGDDLPTDLDERIAFIEEHGATDHIAYNLLRLHKDIQVTETTKKMVCAECGSDDVNEERLVTVNINDPEIYDDCFIGYYCQENCGLTEIIQRK